MQGLPPFAKARLGTVDFRVEGRLTTLAVSPCDRLIAAVAGETAQLLDLDSGRERARFTTCRDSPVAFSPDGRFLASAGENGRIFVWNVATGENVAEFPGNEPDARGAPAGAGGKSANVRAIAFSPDGTVLASGAYRDSRALLWSVTTRRVLHTLEHGRVRTLESEYNPYSDNTTYEEVWAGSTVESLAFSPDGRQLATGSDTGSVRLWDAATGVSSASLDGHAGAPHGIAFSPYGRTLVSIDDEALRLWDASRGTLLGRVDGSKSLAVAFPRDGRRIVWAGGDRTIRVLEATSLSTVGSLELRDLDAFAVVPDGTAIVVGKGEWFGPSTVSVWSLEDGVELSERRGHTKAIRSLRFSADGSQLFSGGEDSARVWDLRTATDVCVVDDRVTSMAISGDGLRAAFGSEHGIRLFDAAGWTPLVRIDLHNYGTDLDRHGFRVAALAFTPDGSTLLSGGANPARVEQGVLLWDREGSAAGFLTECDAAFVTSLACSPDGRLIAAGQEGSRVTVWNLSTGARWQRLEGHTGPVRAVAFSPDGSRLASAGDDATICVWNVEEGREVRRLEGHTGPVRSVAFSPDGESLVSGCDDRLVAVWNVESGTRLQTWQGHAAAIDAVAVAPSRRVASGSDDGDILLWDLPDVAPSRPVAPLRTRPRDLLLLGTRAGRARRTSPFALWGSSIAWGNHRGHVHFFDLDRDRPLGEFEAHPGAVTSISIAAEAGLLASAGGDRVRVWEIDRREMSYEVLAEHPPVRGVAFSPDSALLAWQDDLGGVHLLRARDGESRGSRSEPRQRWTEKGGCVIWSPDGRRLASWSGGATQFPIWLQGAARPERVLFLEGLMVEDVDFSPDGSTLAVARRSHEAQMFDLSSWKARTLRGHRDVNCIAWSPDGKHLATGSRYDGIRLREIATDEVLWELRPDDARRIAFSPDGRWLVVAIPSGEIIARRASS